MNLYEYQAKKLFAKYNMPILTGIVCSTLDEVQTIIKKIKGPWVGKCQIQSGGRGKSGGVKILKSEKDVKSFIKYWLGRPLITYQTDDCGEIVRKILLEPYINIVNELYLSILIDRNTSKIVCLASSKGGVEVESVPHNTPDFTHRVFLDRLIGPQIYQGRKLGFQLGLTFNQVQQFTEIFLNLGKMFLTYDLVLVEINPLIITEQGNLLCLDAKVRMDRNAFFRQEKMLLLENIFQKNQSSLLNGESNYKFNYIPMQGNIGCIVNGAGLAMATMDLLSLYGGKAANFLDVGGDVTKESLVEAIKIILYHDKVQVLLINIFGGIVCCNLIAEGIIRALSIFNTTKPMVVRLEGNNSILGNKKLIDSKYHIFASNSLFDAIQQVISKVNRLK